MARFVRATLTLAAAVRQHFGPTQAELAAFVGVSQANLAHVEAGRKQFGPGPDQRLSAAGSRLYSRSASSSSALMARGSEARTNS